MSRQSRWKLLGAAIIALALLGGVVGWQQFAPRPASPTTVTITPAVSTVTGIQTIVVPSSTESIRPGQIKPINYYLSLLESNGTQPYVQLAQELRKLPDLTNATAVAKITYLALNASNPEVKEAFELMIKGGTPDPRDYQYQVPDYNTELQVLYWLACQSEFRKDDTLALAIAMANGFWVTLGDKQVRGAVRIDATDLLRFFRETNEFQEQREYYQLERYPLEAKVALAWTANSALRDGPHSIFPGPNSQDPYGNSKRLDLAGYRWDTVNVTTLRLMRSFMDRNGLVTSSISTTVGNLEYYMYFSNPRGTGEKGGMDSDHWYYVYENLTPKRVATIIIDGELVRNYVINNVDWLFSYFVKNSKGVGGCGDEAALVDGFSKSIGIATLLANRMVKLSETERTGHGYVVYYDPSNGVWEAYRKQLEMDMDWIPREAVAYFTFVRPPANQHGYLRAWMEGVFWCGAMTYLWRNTTLVGIEERFLAGFQTSEMKQWLLYS